MKIYRAYKHLFTRYWAPYAIGMLALVATNGIYLAIPRVLGDAVDALTDGATRATMIRFAAIIGVLAVGQGITRVASRIYVLGVSRRIDYDLKGLLHDKLVRLAPSFYHALNTGDLMSRMTNDVMLVRALGGPGVLYFINAVLVSVMAAGFMITLSWQLTVIVFLPLPFITWVVRGLANRMKAYTLSSRESLSALNTVVQENLAGVRVVKSFALEEAQIERFDERSRDYMGWALKEAWTRAQMVPTVGLAGGLSYIGVLALGGPMVARGTLSLGVLVAFLTYVTMLVFPTVAFGWILSLIQRGAAALERLDEVMRAPVTIAAPVASGPGSERPSAREPLATFPVAEPGAPAADSSPTDADGDRGGQGGHVHVRGLTFHYGDAQRAYSEITGDGASAGQGRRAALSEIDLEARPGELVALVGRVGSGKSTLLKALLRLIEIPEGTVFLDGRDITGLALEELRRTIAYVPQDDFLFSMSLAENIAYGRPKAEPEAVWDAATAAGLDPELAELPEGLDTPVGERGLTLSGGQRQRASLARAVLVDAPLLVLDNALSHVDTDTERRILARLAEVRENRTVIACSNRITAIQDADRIYVMDQGRVVDVGSHGELIDKPGLYTAMFEQQQLSAQLEAY